MSEKFNSILRIEEVKEVVCPEHVLIAIIREAFVLFAVTLCLLARTHFAFIFSAINFRSRAELVAQTL